MFEKDSNLYIKIGISAAISLFGLAIVLDFFSDNILGIIGIIIGSVLVWICAVYIVDHVVEHLEYTKKGVILVAAVFIAMLLYVLAFLFYFYPNNLISTLIGSAVWLCISLPFSYVLIRSITPIRKTSSTELIILAVIILICLTLILTLSLNSLVTTFCIGATCILVYLFWVLFLSKGQKPSKRVID